MDNLRTYGSPPYAVAVLHGGPGAPGGVAPVARELATITGRGVLEPLQTADSLDGQVAELAAVIEAHGAPPLTLIGWSWGAMLAFITAARHPDLVGKLILVSSGVFDAEYAPAIMETRLSRLAADDRQAIEDAFAQIKVPDNPERDAALAFIGRTFKQKTDSYDLVTEWDTAHVTVQADIYTAVWTDASALRASGDLLALGHAIQCPVIAIHGSRDPHPIDGIQEPLAPVLADFRTITLKRCGHYPWLERHARAAFFEILRSITGSEQLETDTPTNFYIFVAGPFYSGKTSFVRTICTSDVYTPVVHITPEYGMGYDEAYFHVGDATIIFWAHPGPRIWQAFENYFRHFNQRKTAIGIIYLVDSVTPETFREAQKDLEIIAANSTLPLVVVANKQDRPGAVSADDLRNVLALAPDVPIMPGIATEYDSVKNVVLTLIDHALLALAND